MSIPIVQLAATTVSTSCLAAAALLGVSAVAFAAGATLSAARRHDRCIATRREKPLGPAPHRVWSMSTALRLGLLALMTAGAAWILPYVLLHADAVCGCGPYYGGDWHSW